MNQQNQTLKWIVTNPERLDHFLVQKLNISRSKITTLIKNGQILVNNSIQTKAGFNLNVNDTVNLIAINDDSNNKVNSRPYEITLDIKFEDDNLIIVNKPSGLLTHSTIYEESENLINALRTYAKNQWTPYLIHRLDKDTSGLIVFAKNEKTQAMMLDLFQQRAIRKKYYAIVHHHFHENHLIIDVPISRANDNKMKMVAGDRGKNTKSAITEVFLLKNWKKYALLDILLHTGRTHQIRVHLNYINHPIVNDPLYSNIKSNSDYHQYLMAYYLGFIHPITKQNIEIKIELEPEFKKLINEIEKMIS